MARLASPSDVTTSPNKLKGARSRPNGGCSRGEARLRAWPLRPALVRLNDVIDAPIDGASPPGPSLALRALRFEEVADVLRLVNRSVEHGCRTHYDPHQRRAVYAAYATHLFVETLGPLETVVAERAGRLVGMAQLDPREGRLRALFVDGPNQGQGVGQLLLAEVERRARESRVGILHGAMALNAVPFYTRAGFRPAAERVSLRSSTVAIPVLPMEKALARIVAAGR